MNQRFTFRRAWAMPSPDTFSIRPIAETLRHWLAGRAEIIDPFSRNSDWATVRNDLNPETNAQYHMDAIAFLDLMLAERGHGSFDAALLDPPYSPRQIAEVYKQIGRDVTMKDTQNARLYRECKDRLAKLLKAGGVAVTCGWNSGGFGSARGFDMAEVLLVPCGGAHNDYIVTVEVKDVNATDKDRSPAVGGNMPLLFGSALAVPGNV